MQNLVLRDPVLRFKLGNKIIKFLEAGKFPLKRVNIGIESSSLNYSIPKINILPGTVENYTPTYSSEARKLYALWKLRKAGYLNERNQRIKNTKTNSTPDYRKALETTYYSQYPFMVGGTLKLESKQAKLKRENYFNELKKKKGFNSTPVKTDTLNKSNIPINNVWLKGYKHNEIKDVRAMLNELIKLGLLKDRFGADGKWGKNTERAYLQYLALKNVPTYEKPEMPSVAEMAGIYSEENKPLYQQIRFKEGGQLVSRNPILRFKNKKK